MGTERLVELMFRNTTRAVLAGVLIGLPFLTPFWWWSSIIGFAVLLSVVRSATNYKSAFLYGWLAGTVHSCIAISWALTVYPLTWLQVEPIVQLVCVSAVWFTVSMSLGTGLGFFVCAAKWVFIHVHRYVFILTVPVLWVVSEVTGAFIFSLYSFGPASFPNVDFSFGYLGYALTEHSAFLSIAQFGGVYPLSFIVALFGGLLFMYGTYYAITALRVTLAGLLLVVFVYADPLFTIDQTVHSSGTTIIVVETMFDGTYLSSEIGYRSRETELKNALATTFVESEPDIVLLPEDSRFSDQFDNPYEALRWLNSFTSEPVIVVDSAATQLYDGDSVIRAIVYDLSNDTVSYLDKQYLVPQGEYLPTISKYTLLAAGLEDLVANFQKQHSFLPGPYRSYTGTSENLPGILFCFESASPSGVKNASSLGSLPYVLHPISHGWFHEPTQLWHQLDMMLRTQAVATGVAVVSAGNMTTSKVYMPDGRVIVPPAFKETNRWLLREITF